MKKTAAFLLRHSLQPLLTMQSLETHPGRPWEQCRMSFQVKQFFVPLFSGVTDSEDDSDSKESASVPPSPASSTASRSTVEADAIEAPADATEAQKKAKYPKDVLDTVDRLLEEDANALKEALKPKIDVAEVSEDTAPAEKSKITNSKIVGTVKTPTKEAKTFFKPKADVAETSEATPAAENAEKRFNQTLSASDTPASRKVRGRGTVCFKSAAEILIIEHPPYKWDLSHEIGNGLTKRKPRTSSTLTGPQPNAAEDSSDSTAASQRFTPGETKTKYAQRIAELERNQLKKAPEKINKWDSDDSDSD